MDDDTILITVTVGVIKIVIRKIRQIFEQRWLFEESTYTLAAIPSSVSVHPDHVTCADVEFSSPRNSIAPPLKFKRRKKEKEKVIAPFA